jgi:hypothetical protein
MLRATMDGIIPEESEILTLPEMVKKYPESFVCLSINRRDYLFHLPFTLADIVGAL